MTVPFEYDDYENSAIVALEAGQELLARLSWMKLQPKCVLDLGCGPGHFSAQLKSRYPDAQIFSVDHCERMLESAKEKNNLTIHAEVSQLPFPNQSVDLIFANFIFSWHHNPTALLQECRRILSTNGLLIFTVLGPDTLQTYPALKQQLLPTLSDLHDVGDLLLEQGFSDPVLEANHLTLVYRDPKKLLHELITGQLLNSNCQIDVMHHEPIEIQFEIVYAHAFLSSDKKPDDSSAGGFRISLEQFRKQLKLL